MNRSIRFADLTRVELAEASDAGVTVLVPLGATEQHGPHLPADTDTFLAEQMCLACAERLDDVLVAPAVPWGLSAGHLPLGATVTLRPQTYLELLLDIADSLIASGFPNQVYVNGHNSNKSMQMALVYEAQRRWGVGVGAVSYYDFAGSEEKEICESPDYHAGEKETSIFRAFGEERLQPIPAGTGNLPVGVTSYESVGAGSGPALVGLSYVERFPDGVAGDPSLSSVEKGRRLTEVNLDGLVGFVGEYAASRRQAATDSA